MGPYWDAVNTTPRLPDETDVVVVGGGIMGTSTAFFLADRTDLDVCLVEKSAIAAGSTGDSSAILRHHYGTHEPYTRMAVWSHEFYRAFESNVGEPLAHADNPLVRFAADGTPAAEFARGGYELLSDLDVPVSWVEHDAFDERYPMLAVEEFDFGVSDDTAGYSDGTDAAGGFSRAAQRRGATVVTGIEVTEVRVEDGCVTGVDTTTGAVDCSHVVIAAGPWTPRLAATVGLDVPVTPTREQVLILDRPEEYDASFADLPPTISLPGADWYVRPDFGDGILIATHHSAEECDPEHYRDRPDEDVILRLADQLAETVPALADAAVKGQYCGVYSTTPDNDFILDQAGPDGCFLACGFSGHGFKHGPAIGRILADLFVDGSTDFVDLEPFSFDRFGANSSGNDATAAASEYRNE